MALNLVSQECAVRVCRSHLAYVACGRLMHTGNGILALGRGCGLLVASAGGRLSTYTCTAFDGLGPQIVASNGHLHDAILSQLAAVRRRS
jgi:fructose-1,6-bisphosphatase/inositol monophosphatase family enzyme